MRRVKAGEMRMEELESDIKKLEEVLEMEFTPADKAILEILERRKCVRVHVHKEDDVFFLIDMVKRYNIRAVADHLCDIYRKEPFEMLKKDSVPIVYGPLDSLAYKTELKHETYKNVKPLIESGVKFTLMSDHPVVLTRNLFLQLRYFLMYGYNEEKAISILTKEAAEILRIDDVLGTIKPGKWASVLIWDKNPFILGAKPKVVIGEGKILHEEEK